MARFLWEHFPWIIVMVSFGVLLLGEPYFAWGLIAGHVVGRAWAER